MIESTGTTRWPRSRRATMFMFAMAACLALAACAGDEQQLSDESASVQAISLFSDGRIAAAESSNLHVWRDGDEVSTIFDHTSRINTVATLRDGRILSGGADGLIRIWDPENPSAEPVVFIAHIGQVLAIAELPDGRIASGDNHEELHIWDPDNPQPPEFTLSASSIALGVLPDGRLVSTPPGEGQVQIWDVASPDAGPEIFEYHEGTVRTFAVLGDGRVATGDADGVVKVWDPLAPDDDPLDLVGHVGAVHTVIALDDQRVVTGGADGSVRVWDLTEPTAARTVFDEGDLEVRSLAETSDGTVIAGFSDGTLRTWRPDGES